MGIRLKIALGFALLTIVVVSVVSFWAAQSLGFSLDSSDYNKLENLKNQLIAQLASEQRTLDRLAAETAQVFADTGFLQSDNIQQQRQAERIKTALNADWLEIFREIDAKAVIFPNAAFSKPELKHGFPVRIARSGPFSYRGYILSQALLPDQNAASLCMARAAAPRSSPVEFFCIFDAQGVLLANGFNPDIAVLEKFAKENITHQLQVGEELFRIRIFDAGNEMRILTGYPAQRATLSRAGVDQLMLRLAILEVIGLLILGYFLGKRLFSPLNALKHGMEQVAEGHWRELPLDQPPIENSGDEVESVARSFNRMVRELSIAQNRLIDVQKELAKKEKMAALGRFSAGIAHEINNPLGTILVTAGMLKEAAASGTGIPPEEFDAIIEEVKRCRDIIGTLRTYTGRAQPQLSHSSFAAFFNDISAYLLNEPELKTVELNITPAPLPEGFLLVDRKAMHQVFNNLVKNAIEAMSQVSHAKINLFADRQPDHFRIRVQDYGRGFECLPEHIFEPLFTTKAQGTGLGLVICQAIVEGHHGKIEATRIDDTITEFCIRLPFADKGLTLTEE